MLSRHSPIEEDMSEEELSYSEEEQSGSDASDDAGSNVDAEQDLAIDRGDEDTIVDGEFLANIRRVSSSERTCSVCVDLNRLEIGLHGTSPDRRASSSRVAGSASSSVGASSSKYLSNEIVTSLTEFQVRIACTR